MTTLRTNVDELSDSRDQAEEPPTVDELNGQDRSYQRYDLSTQPDGTIRGRTFTNDNLDRGYPTEYSEWAVDFRDFNHMKERTRLSHIGVSGTVVTVVLDGREV